MNQEKRTISPASVGIEVFTFLAERYGEQCDQQEVLQGVWLAMQMAGSPRGAADVMRYCGVNFAAK